MAESRKAWEETGRASYASWAAQPGVRYAAAVVAVAVAGVVRWALDPLLGVVQPFAIFFLPVLLMGWWAGRGPAVLAALLGFLVGDWFFATPRGSLSFSSAPGLTAGLVFLTACAVLIGVTDQMRLARQRAETIFRSITDAFVGLDRQWRFTHVNPAAERMLGQPAAALVGRNAWEIFTKAEVFRQRYQQALASGQAVHFEAFYAPLKAWFEVHAYPSAQGLAVYFRDISEQKRAEEARAESEQRYRSFVEASSQVIWRTNSRGAVDQPIPSWAAYTGQSDAAAAGFGWMQAIHPEDRPRVVKAWESASAARTLYEVEYRLKRHDGQWRQILARGVPVLQSDGQVREYIGTCIDVTEQRQARETLQKQARLIDLTPSANIMRNLDGTITFWSDGAEKLYGWTRQEALGCKTHDLLCTEFPTPLAVIVEELRRGGRWVGELRHQTKAGGAIIVESHWLGQFTAAGEIVEMLESNMDVTQRKHTEAELLRLKEELEHRVQQRTAELAAANKELEAFGYSVSHDLRAPLRHIDSYGKLLEKNVGPRLDEKSQKHLRIVLEAVKRMGHLLDDLLVLSRLGRAAMEERTVNLRRLVDEARQELAPAMAGRAIEWQVGPLPRVRGDPNLLRSAISNLLGNAIKYTRSRQPARIEVGSRQEDGEVICFVRDNGVGFEMKFADKLFGVFQRLHTLREFEGTGIGLASVRRVIQRHGGRTWAEAELDRGASFYFSLPLSRVTDQAE
jgi:PAS domain S-box-containing protein